MEDKTPKAIEQVLANYQQIGFTPITTVTKLLENGFSEEQIKAVYTIPDNRKPIQNGGSSNLLGVLYIILFFIGIYLSLNYTGNVFGSFHYIFRGEGDITRANLLVIQPFLSFACFLIGLGLLFNRASLNKIGKRSILILTIISFLFCFASSNPMTLIMPIMLLISILFTKVYERDKFSDAEIILNGLQQKHTDERIAKSINAKPRKGTNFALLILFCFFLYLSSPLRLTTLSGYGEVSFYEKIIYYTFLIIFYTTIPVCLFLWFKKNNVIILIYSGLALLLSLLLVFHQHTQTAIIPSFIIVLFGIITVIKSIKPSSQEIKNEEVFN